MIDLKQALEKYPFCINNSSTLKSVLYDMFPGIENKSRIYIISVILELGIIKQIKKKDSFDEVDLRKYSSALENNFGFKNELCVECLKTWAIAFDKCCVNEVLDNHDEQKIIKPALPNMNVENEEFIIKDGCLVEYIGDQYPDQRQRRVGAAYKRRKWVNFVQVPEGVTAIGTCAFLDSHIKQVVLPSTCSVIEDQAFMNSCISEIRLPDSIELIGIQAFYGCKSLRRFTLPPKIEVIYKETFSGCESLEKMELNNRLKSIGVDAFCHCESLFSIEIPSSVKKIAPGAFYNDHDQLVIKGKKSSYANKYADEEYIEFESI